MKYTIPKDSKPIGTEHFVDASFFGINVPPMPVERLDGGASLITSNDAQFAYYKVHAVQGASHFYPGDGQPIIWLTLSRKTALAVPMVLSLPLDLFVQHFNAVSLKDDFWDEQ